MVKRQQKSKRRLEIDSAERKYQLLIEKRDLLNLEARAIADERNKINERKKELITQMKEVKETRDKLVTEMREHKHLRNQYHNEARNLIDTVKRKRKNLSLRIFDKVDALRSEIQDMEMKQQTIVLSLPEENELIARIREKISDLKTVESMAMEHEAITEDIVTLETRITELFELANEEHQKVVNLYAESQEQHNKLVALMNEIGHLITEGKKKHEEYLKLKELANEQHLKAKTMREKVISTRKELWREVKEAKEIVEKHREDVRKTFEDETKLEKIAEESVQELFKKGKFTIG